MSTIPQVGIIFPDDPSAYPVYSQPGGPGTITFPQQTDGEKIGMFVSPCNHWFNAWRVQFTSYIDGENVTHWVALVQCPVCTFIAQIIEPASDIYAFENYYIIG